MRAIALLSWWQLRNSVRSIFTDPKKLLPFAIFAAAIGMNLWLGRMARNGDDPSGVRVAQLISRYAAESHALLFLLLAAFALLVVGRGFTGRALIFSPADVDYLFPSPVSRRVVLAYKLPGLMGKQAWGTLGIVYLVYYFLWRHLPGGAATRDVWLLFLGAFLWQALYSNVAVAIEVAFGLRQSALGSRLIQAALVLVAACAVFLVWRNGLSGVTALERNVVFAALFYPCRLLADVLLAPVSGHAAGQAVALLAALCAASVALALSRRENYYEATLEATERAAVVREAARGGNAFAAWSAARRRAPARDFSRPYALEPFGRGAMAVLWAHLAALAKRPLGNFAAPFGIALAGSAGLVFWRPGAATAMVPLIAGYYLFIIAMMSRQTTFRVAVDRHPLMRPLPVAPWKLVAVDVGAAALPGTLGAWGAGLPLLAGDDASLLVAALLLAAAPPVLVCVLLISYACAFWYPDMSDRAGQMIASLVFFALLSVLGLVLAIFVVPIALLRLPFLLALTVPLGCVLAGAALLAVAARAFAGSER